MSNYRTEEFEQALAAYATQETGTPNGWKTRDIIINRLLAQGIDGLQSIDAFLQQKIGRGLEADDFCRKRLIFS